MSRQFYTANDIYLLMDQQKPSVLVLGPDDVITNEAADLANSLGLNIVQNSIEKKIIPNPVALCSLDTSIKNLPPLKAVKASLVELEHFGIGSSVKESNVFLKDIITSIDGSPIAVGYMSLDGDSFPWKLNYDEIDVILEGELVITRGEEEVKGKIGDVIFIPKGSSIIFSTPDHVRFVYVTFPADWKEK